LVTRPRRVAGFTLLELLVVLVLMALITGMAIPLISAGTPGAQIKAASRELIAGLRQAREQAIVSRQPAALTIDVQTRRFQISGQPRAFQLPGKLQIGLYVAEVEDNGKLGSFIFYPDGSSTGGRVTVSLDGQTNRIDVDWLTGVARLQD
jgi:general secretion pathway protein H